MAVKCFAGTGKPGCAFGTPIDSTLVVQAIAQFERTLVSAESKYDRWLAGEIEFTPEEEQGFLLFHTEQADCFHCHVAPLYTDNQFHNIGVGVKDEELTDLGRSEITKKEADHGAFKTPSLRNIALTAPYMHDGSLKTLREVVDFYVGGGNSNPYLDPQLKVLTPTTETGEVNWSGADLEAFLEALTGEIPSNVGSPK